MNKYVAILRGINVSGQKKVKMADLRIYLSELNFYNVQTYIQSGNIIFEYDSDDIKFLENQIKNKIKEKYNFDVPTIVITKKEIEYVLKNNPFKIDQKNDHKKNYVTFLAKLPAKDKIEKLKEVDYSPEKFVLDGKYIYLFFPDGAGKAKLTNNFFESKLKVEATTRNWKTINKLYELVCG